MDRVAFKLVVEELLKPELGTFEGGQPAIWTDLGDSPKKVTGLACMIDFFEIVNSQVAIFNNEADVNFDRVLRLIQRDRSPPGIAKLDSAIRKIKARFPNQLRSRPLPPADGVYPQITFLVNFNQMICTENPEPPY